MFSDLLVIDLSTVLAGPSVGTFFAELGARVIKVEHPHHPDVTRTWKLPNEPDESDVSAYFASVNYKKEYQQLDLRNEHNHETFLDLIAKADILLSNFKPGDEEKLNIEDQTLRAINPKLIRGKITGFGDTSDRVAYDLILQAETGFMSMNGTPESGPVKMPVAMIDVLAGHQLKEGLLLALMERATSGLGRTITVSLFDAAICSLMNQASNFLMTDKVPQRIGSLHPNIAPYGEIFTTSDRESITLAIGSNLHFKKLCSFLSLNELPDNTKFMENNARVLHRSELFEILQCSIQHVKADMLLSAMHEQHVPVAKINSLDEVFKENTAKELIRVEEINGIPTKRVTSIAFKWK